MFIKPVRIENIELKIPDPERKDFLPQEGRAVNPSAYWTRCLNRGEIEIIENHAEEEKDE
jgi:hypothetical protein